MVDKATAQDVIRRIVQLARDSGDVTPEEYQMVAKTLGFQVHVAQIRCPRIDAKSGRVLEHSNIRVEIFGDSVFLSASNPKTSKLWRMTIDQWESLIHPEKEGE